jgi:hypothetical protein
MLEHFLMHPGGHGAIAVPSRVMLADAGSAQGIL